MIDSARIRAALDAAGYEHEPATEDALKSCFLDYVDSGYWRDLSPEDVEEIKIEEMAKALIRG